MDPNETLAELRHLLGIAPSRRMAANAAVEHESTDLEIQELLDALIDLERVAVLFGALDGWLSRGGFLPAAWIANRR